MSRRIPCATKLAAPLLPLTLLTLLLLAMPAALLRAQIVANPLAAKPAAAAPPAAPALSPAESRQMLDLLNDPQKRAAFAATLETFTKAQNATSAAHAAAAAPVKLAPGSVGAQLLREGTAWLGGLSGQLASFGQVLGDLPAVWAFTLRTAQNPAQRALAFDAAWRLALVLALAGLAEWASWRLLRRPMRAIARRAPEAVPLPVAEEEVPAAQNGALAARVGAAVLSREIAEGTIDPEAASGQLPAVAVDLPQTSQAGLLPASREEAEVEHALRRRRFARMLRTVKRLPFVLLCFVLDLVPLGAFLGVGYGGTLFESAHSQAVLQAGVLAYAVCRLATSLTRMVFAPELPALRLAHVSDQGAAYAVIWVRRIFAVAAFGFAATSIGQLFGLPQPANDAFLKAVFLVVHLMLVVVVLQCRAAVAERIASHAPNPGIGATLRNRLAAVWHLIAIFYIVALWMVWAAEVRHGYLRIWHLFLVTVGVVGVARLLSIVLLGALERALRIAPDVQASHPGLERRANRYLPLLRRVIDTVLVVITLLALLQAWGVNTLVWFRTNALGGKLVSAGATILIAAALAVAVWEGVNAAMDRHLGQLTKTAQTMRSARLRTLMPILRTMLFASLAAVFGLTALSEIGVNIAPLLAGAGILGVAIGFGSQKLVQDFITGIFLLIENAMQVGDWVTVAGLSGAVENLSIRTMRLRAGDGSVHIIPFSSVSTVTNVNRGIGNAAVSVSVPVEEDSDRVCDLLSDIAREMRREDRFAEMMRSDFQLWGVDRVEAGAMTIAGQIVCSDSGRWAVQREFNRRMTIRFKERGVRIAVPVSTVYNHIAQQQAAPPAQDVADRPAGQLAQSPPPAALGNTA